MKTQDKDSQLYIVILLPLLVTIAAYLQVLRADFVNYDDDAYVTANPHVQSGLTAEGFKWAFNIGYASNWHPLTWISHMLDCQVCGPGPTGPHAVNLLLHLANILLLFLLLNRMTRSLWKSAFVAALFAVHPMHVESVAWVAERKDVLSTLFWLLTMWAYVRYSEAPNLKRYAVMLVSFALGLMSKPTLVTLPFALLLLDYWPLGRWADAPWHARWRLVMQKLPLIAMSVAACVVTYLAQQSRGAICTMTELPFSSRITNTPMAYVSYIAKMLWPARLATFYPHPVSVPAWDVLAAVMILAAVTTLAIRSARSRPYLIMGWLWYLVVLAPMIGLVQVGSQAMADRYTYVPFIGLFIMIAWGVSDLFSRRVSVSPRLRVVPALVVVVLAACTWRQAGYWRDGVTLWTHTLAVTTGNAVAHNNLGVAYGSLGIYAKQVKECAQAIRINPNYAVAHNNLGVAYDRLGMYIQSVAEYKQSIHIDPDVATAHCNLGVAYFKLGMYIESVPEYKQAIRIDPDHGMAHNSLGFVLAKQGKLVEATAEFRIAVRINPRFTEAHYGLADVLSKQGQIDDAETHYTEALRINPRHAKAHYGLALILVQKGLTDGAVNHLRQAITTKPDYASAYNSLGMLLGQRERFDEAVECFAEAVKYRPNFPEAHCNLAIALFSAGRYAEAHKEISVCKQYKVKRLQDLLEEIASKMPAR